MHCEEARWMILELTLESGPTDSKPLREHLRGCPACSYFLARVEETDLALRALPVESAPAGMTRQVLAQAAARGDREGFLPWSVWLPVLSLLAGLIWAYVTLVWRSGPALISSVNPALAEWLARAEEWLMSQQATLSAVGLSVGAGLLFTVLAIGLGLYIGRQRVATSH